MNDIRLNLTSFDFISGLGFTHTLYLFSVLLRVDADNSCRAESKNVNNEIDISGNNQFKNSALPFSGGEIFSHIS